MTRLNRWRRTGLWVLAVVLGIAALAAIAIATTPPGAAMDPDDVGPGGGAALVAVLEQNGVDVETATSIGEVRDALAEGDDDTSLVVANTSNLGTVAAATLRQESLGLDRVVVLSPSTEQLRALRADATALPIGAAVRVESRCDIGTVDEGDSLVGFDVRYQPGSGVPSSAVCFPLTLDGSGGEGEHGVGLVQLPSTSAHPPMTVIGTTTGFTNGAITEEHNAAIALRLLGGSPRLIWYQPDVAELAGSDDAADDGSLLPGWLAPALGLLAAALVVLALVRGRR
ncbi:hypothetical protein N798_10035, partial [Knoellia flava TL1]